MAKRRSLEQCLADLEGLRSEPISDDTLAKLRRALSEKNNHLVATAAGIVRERRIGELEHELLGAFERFMTDSVKRDPGCAAKTALVEALYTIDSGNIGVYLQGIHHVQLEPIYGGREDTAARLRSVCALGLVFARYEHTAIELARLLADPETEARVGAIEALFLVGPEAGVPLLVYKTLAGDDSPRVMNECFRTLLKSAPEKMVGFVAEFLYAENETVCESAALALGESQLERAFEPLRKAWESRIESSVRQTLLVSMALLRQEESFALLLQLISEESAATARSAITAMEIYRGDWQLWERVTRAVEARSDTDLRALL